MMKLPIISALVKGRPGKCPAHGVTNHVCAPEYDERAEINIFLQFVSPALLVPAKTGVIYEHQCGGADLHYPRLEGFLIPLGSVDVSHIDDAIKNRKLERKDREAWLADIASAIAMDLDTVAWIVGGITLDKSEPEPVIPADVPVLAESFGRAWLIYENDKG